MKNQWTFIDFSVIFDLSLIFHRFLSRSDRMFVEFSWSKTKFAIFFRFLPFIFKRKWRRSNVTQKMVLILVDMGIGDQDLYLGTKYSTTGPLLYTIYRGCNNSLGKIWQTLVELRSEGKIWSADICAPRIKSFLCDISRSKYIAELFSSGSLQIFHIWIIWHKLSISWQILYHPKRVKIV